MEGEDQGTGAIGEHAERSCEKDEVDISWGREQGLDTQFIFESCKHCHELYQVEYISSASAVGHADVRCNLDALWFGRVYEGLWTCRRV